MHFKIRFHKPRIHFHQHTWCFLLNGFMKVLLKFLKWPQLINKKYYCTVWLIKEQTGLSEHKLLYTVSHVLGCDIEICNVPWEYVCFYMLCGFWLIGLEHFSNSFFLNHVKLGCRHFGYTELCKRLLVIFPLCNIIKSRVIGPTCILHQDKYTKHKAGDLLLHSSAYKNNQVYRTYLSILFEVILHFVSPGNSSSFSTVCLLVTWEVIYRNVSRLYSRFHCKIFSKNVKKNKRKTPKNKNTRTLLHVE